MSDDAEARVQALETKLAYQELALTQLNEVIVTQQQRLDRLETVCRALRARLQSLADDGGADPDTHEPPPHY